MANKWRNAPLSLNVGTGGSHIGLLTSQLQTREALRPEIPIELGVDGDVGHVLEKYKLRGIMERTISEKP